MSRRICCPESMGPVDGMAIFLGVESEADWVSSLRARTGPSRSRGRYPARARTCLALIAGTDSTRQRPSLTIPAGRRRPAFEEIKKSLLS